MIKKTVVGSLVALGIVYGDIGTSPLYVMNAIVQDGGGIKHLTDDYLLGSLSLIFWTLFLITTVKYLFIAMQADNNKEGGIFSLFTLVRKQAKWLIIPALIGGASLLADGTLTPAVTVTSAIEGLKGQKIGPLVFGRSTGQVVLIVSIILLIIFLFQRMGTSIIGKSFGPLMFIWFAFIGFFGFVNLLGHLEILKALSPLYAINVLFAPDNKVGFFLLGSIFLATTGAEALYSDMGHVGKANIYRTWPFVFLCLMLSYFGQAAWLLENRNSAVSQTSNPFYSIIPENFRTFAILIATIAAIIASQALITGSFTLVSEAIGLKLLPRLKIRYPGRIKNQSYIATVNWLLFATTLAVVIFFQSSRHMEAAYGLAITITMLMTTLLLQHFIVIKGHKILSWIFVIFYMFIEGCFLIASLVKFIHGGYITLLITICILMIMVFWFFGNRIKRHYTDQSQYLSIKEFAPMLKRLSEDDNLPIYADNLIYMNRIKEDYMIKRQVLYSIFDKRPKRARVYWFITVNQTDVPYESNYTVDMLGTRNIVDVQLYLGFKKPQAINIYLRQIITDLINDGVIDQQKPKYSTMSDRKVGDFKFVFLNQQQQDLNYNSGIKAFDRFMISGRLLLQNITQSQASWYGLEFSEYVEETVPLFVAERKDNYLVQKKIYNSK
ncbi:KUP/HAK/KT family potassium transporter [Oenococcus alcoholitolerans]|uniref:KUP/HAK/KT family potassium transporter n=1 Tax=Oenococcus alcoholitolerans TaxID=931074 RepID=UPI003F6F20EC